MSAFSAYFQVRYLEDADTFDADAGVNHERTEVRDEAGTTAAVDLWTTCFTPRELRLLAARAGPRASTPSGRSTPGALRAEPPTSTRPSSCSSRTAQGDGADPRYGGSGHGA